MLNEADRQAQLLAHVHRDEPGILPDALHWGMDGMPQAASTPMTPEMGWSFWNMPSSTDRRASWLPLSVARVHRQRYKELQERRGGRRRPLGCAGRWSGRYRHRHRSTTSSKFPLPMAATPSGSQKREGVRAVPVAGGARIRRRTLEVHLPAAVLLAARRLAIGLLIGGYGLVFTGQGNNPVSIAGSGQLSAELHHNGRSLCLVFRAGERPGRRLGTLNGASDLARATAVITHE